MDDQQNDLQARLKALQDAYAKQLPDKLAAILDDWQSLAQGWDWEIAKRLHHQIHSIAGSGGSFGFAELGSLARQIEIELKAYLKEQRQPEETQQREIGQKISALCSATDNPA